jgi:hypothetical protein
MSTFSLILSLDEPENPPTVEALQAALDKTTQVDADGLPIELTRAEAGAILRCAPWALRDAIGLWLGAACRNVGMTDRLQRIKLQEELRAWIED